MKGFASTLEGRGGIERAVALGTILAVFAALMLVFASPARAHDISIEHNCYGWSLDLTAYNTSGDNSVVITIDGSEVDSVDDFGRDYSNSDSWDPTKDHTILIVVRAHDDPGLTHGWSFDYSSSEKACEEETTTTTVDESTTTTLDETSTTRPTTPTTEPPTTVPPTTAEILPTSITAAPTTIEIEPVDTLPFTGAESGTSALLAMALIGIGALALVVTRRAED